MDEKDYYYKDLIVLRKYFISIFFFCMLFFAVLSGASEKSRDRYISSAVIKTMNGERKVSTTFIRTRSNVKGSEVNIRESGKSVIRDINKDDLIFPNRILRYNSERSRWNNLTYLDVAAFGFPYRFGMHAFKKDDSLRNEFILSYQGQNILLTAVYNFVEMRLFLRKKVRVVNYLISGVELDRKERYQWGGFGNIIMDRNNNQPILHFFELRRKNATEDSYNFILEYAEAHLSSDGENVECNIND